MATVEELKEMLIEEKVGRIVNSVPNGHCPNVCVIGSMLDKEELAKLFHL